jgi:hypothetical protein
MQFGGHRDYETVFLGCAMSYDIWLEADLGGPERMTVTNGWNYTSNCGPIWRLAGADLAEYHGKPAAECIPSLRAAIIDMQANPEKYRPLEPENGWGSLETLVPALGELLAEFAMAPLAIVVVSR